MNQPDWRDRELEHLRRETAAQAKQIKELESWPVYARRLENYLACAGVDITKWLGGHNARPGNHPDTGTTRVGERPPG